MGPGFRRDDDENLMGRKRVLSAPGCSPIHCRLIASLDGFFRRPSGLRSRRFEPFDFRLELEPQLRAFLVRQ
jgi:hypothetical protein